MSQRITISDYHKAVLSPVIIVVTLVSMLFSSCDLNKVFDDMKRIKNSEWNKLEVLPFEFTIDDTTALYNVYIQIRNTTDYPFSNLYLFLTTRDANGFSNRDTLECLLAAPDGKWLGRGTGKIKENRILIKKDMRWMKAGQYQINIQHAMRNDVLQGISDIGLRIEKE